MKKLSWSTKRAVLFLLFTLFGGFHLTVIAEQSLPAYYPDPLPKIGLVYDVGISNGAWVDINGNKYSVDSGVTVHLLKRQYGSIDNIKVGMGVAYNLIQVGNAQKIGELWELPESMTPPPS